MANHKTGAQRYNDRMDKVFSNAHKLEKERLGRGEEPNPSLTSPEEAKKHGWTIKGREVTRDKKRSVAEKMTGYGSGFPGRKPPKKEKPPKGGSGMGSGWPSKKP